MRASLYKTGDDKNPLYEVSGQWSDELVFKDLRTKTELETYDTHKNGSYPLIITPVEKQDPWESRRAWADVITALQAGDMQATSDAKSKVEKAQRQMRKKEKAAGKVWEPKFFSRVEKDPEFERLAAPHGELLQEEMTSGIWKFDVDKFRRAQGPYHGDLVPWCAD